jgi:hypothetical protein
MDPLLGNDREIRNYTTAVTRERPVNSKIRTVFSVLSVQRFYKQGQLDVEGGASYRSVWVQLWGTAVRSW